MRTESDYTSAAASVGVALRLAQQVLAEASVPDTTRAMVEVAGLILDEVREAEHERLMEAQRVKALAEGRAALEGKPAEEEKKLPPCPDCGKTLVAKRCTSDYSRWIGGWESACNDCQRIYEGADTKDGLFVKTWNRFPGEGVSRG